MKKRLIVNALTKKAPLGDLFGIFFEDLNHASDGGLYAELIQNRSFEFAPVDHPHYHALTGWELYGTNEAEIYVADSAPLHPLNPHYLVIDKKETGLESGVKNSGFNGIFIEKQKRYVVSFYAKSETKLNLSVLIESKDGLEYISQSFKIDSSEWKKYTAIFKAEISDTGARLALSVKEHGLLCIDMVSFFPLETFKNQTNGLRKDLALLLEQLKPKFLRFPGGCLVHDGSLDDKARDSMYRWKNTIGKIEERPSKRNNWSYNQSLGLGFYEYFRLCEDLGAKAIPVLPGGYDPHHGRMVPIDELKPWI